LVDAMTTFPTDASELDALFGLIATELGFDGGRAPTVAVPAARPPQDGCRSVFLDLKDWINLAKARAGRADGEPFEPIYRRLVALTANGELVVPLSSAIYMEPQHAVRSPRQRADVADVMSEVSRFWSLAPWSNLLPCEVDASLHARRGRPAFPQKPVVFGVGFGFALMGQELTGEITGPPEGRAALVERLGVEEGFAELVRRFNEIANYVMLRGPTDDELVTLGDYGYHP
jgi:hypothetical protein